MDVYPTEALPTIPVTMGEKSTVQPIFSSRDKILMEKTKVSAVEKSMELEESVSAPVEEGQPIGTLTITSEGETLTTIPLVAGKLSNDCLIGILYKKCCKKLCLLHEFHCPSPLFP